jgi:hypothetical protein
MSTQPQAPKAKPTPPGTAPKATKPAPKLDHVAQYGDDLGRTYARAIGTFMSSFEAAFADELRRMAAEQGFELEPIDVATLPDSDR